ncbi:hypothetical protein C8F04DRAFT_1066235 [Mycena alexandri]|uniref:Protein CPL1-like domain-containing protein n=1 Tax=Mycena alexandri TaxID=1745969 RepID=A0AAD6XDB9_9AGAR|nr:hypothetical protein C8F04DRAFT_1066235 [Mycena alexandri]
MRGKHLLGRRGCYLLTLHKRPGLFSRKSSMFIPTVATNLVCIQGSATCKGCPPGQFILPIIGRSCNNCPRDTYGAGGLSQCAICPFGTSSVAGSSSCTPNPLPSHRAQPREQKILSCPLYHALCPVMAGSGTFECVDIQNSLESCGGCVGGSPSTGEDCSAIPGADAVSCTNGRCAVTQCRGNLTVSLRSNSCVAAVIPTRKKGFFRRH